MSLPRPRLKPRQLMLPLYRWTTGASRGSLIAGAAGGAVAVALLGATGWQSHGAPSASITIQEHTAPSPLTSRGYRSSARDVDGRAAPAVVTVHAAGRDAEAQSAAEYAQGEGGGNEGAAGTGFEVDSAGDILTALHVVENTRNLAITFRDGKTVQARLVGTNASDDLALLHPRAVPPERQPLVLGASNSVRVGDEVLAIGDPFGLQGTMTRGIVSARNRAIAAPDGATIHGALQTDAPVNPGNSGGPLLNLHGEVIGVLSQIETTGNRGGSVGIAFAVPSDTVKRDLARLEDGVRR